MDRQDIIDQLRDFAATIASWQHAADKGRGTKTAEAKARKLVKALLAPGLVPTEEEIVHILDRVGLV